MSMKRTAAVAIATAGVVTTLSHAALPDSKSLTPAGRNDAAVKQISEIDKRTQRERRQAAKELDDAIRRDKLRPGVHSPPPGLGRDLVRTYLRRLP